MDFYVVLNRPGMRVKNRKSRKSRVGKFQKVTKDDAVKWFEQEFSGEVV